MSVTGTLITLSIAEGDSNLDGPCLSIRGVFAWLPVYHGYFAPQINRGRRLRLRNYGATANGPSHQRQLQQAQAFMHLGTDGVPEVDLSICAAKSLGRPVYKWELVPDHEA
ncbi:hypothetical protein VTJ04DRAFT_5659 [Mycothermus thermophilus]|uniref:uncharacterized protein n=1 Tax=Humicola insolens TaxID=85995 RepID=UPI0037425AEF